MKVENGYVTKTGIDVFLNDLVRLYKGVHGEDANTEPGTELGDEIQAHASAFEYLDQRMLGLNQVGKIDTAFGSALSAMVKTRLNTDRFQASRTVASVQFAGTTGTLIPVNTQVEDVRGNIFQTTANANIPSAGTVEVGVQSVNKGYLDIPAQSITKLVDDVSGVSGVTQPTAGVPGTNAESDSELLARYTGTLSRNAIADLDAFEAAALSVPNVRDVWTDHNPTLTPYTLLDGREYGVQLDAKSVLVVIDGGDDDEIAAALYNVRVDGGATFSGDTVVRVTDPVKGLSTVFQDVKFQRPRLIPVQISLSIAVVDNAAFTGNVLSEGEVIESMAGTIAGYVGSLKIGDALKEPRLSNALYNAYRGFDVQGDITIERTADAPGRGPVSDLANLQYADLIVVGQDDEGNDRITVSLASA